MPRAFIALDLPYSIRKRLLIHGKDIKSGRLVKLEQLHLTLRFLGEVDNDNLRAITSSLKGLKTKDFQFTIDKLGYFTMGGGRAVIWAGISDNQELFDLKFSIDRYIQSVFPPEIKRYKPHITLVRLKNTPVSKLKNFIASHTDFTTMQVTASTFTLYTSTLSSEGAIHSPIAVFPLS